MLRRNIFEQKKMHEFSMKRIHLKLYDWCKLNWMLHKQHVRLELLLNIMLLQNMKSIAFLLQMKRMRLNYYFNVPLSRSQYCFDRLNRIKNFKSLIHLNKCHTSFLINFYFRDSSNSKSYCKYCFRQSASDI